MNIKLTTLISSIATLLWLGAMVMARIEKENPQTYWFYIGLSLAIGFGLYILSIFSNIAAIKAMNARSKYIVIGTDTTVRRYQIIDWTFGLLGCLLGIPGWVLIVVTPFWLLGIPLIIVGAIFNHLSSNFHAMALRAAEYNLTPHL